MVVCFSVTLARLRKDRMMTVVKKTEAKRKTEAEMRALKERANKEGTAMGMRGKVLGDYVRNRLAPYRR